MYLRKGAVIALIMLTVLLSGFAAAFSAAPPPVAAPTPQPTGLRMNSIVIIDRNLQFIDASGTMPPQSVMIFADGRPENMELSMISVEGNGARRSPTDTAEVWATFRNRTDAPLTIECRTTFFDLQQAPVEGPTAWHRVHLPQQSVGSYREFSTNVMEVAYYYIEVRGAQ